MRRTYLKLSNTTCTFNASTGIWSIDLPRDFINSDAPNKRINVLTFMYFVTTEPTTTNIVINTEYTTFHSPTLCDGNFNQDNYICTLCYTQSAIARSYPIKSKPQKLEFYFRDSNNELIISYEYFGQESDSTVGGSSTTGTWKAHEKFAIDLELIY